MIRYFSKLISVKLTTIFFLCFVFAAFFYFSHSTSAQAAVYDQNDNYSAVLYNNTNGLPTSEANAIVQSEDGYIFIGSYSGLTFYDGVTFTRFSAQTGITSVVSLFIDKDDRLWIGTNDSGLVLYDKGEYTFYGREEGLSSLSVRSITQDDEGRIVFATTEGLLYIDENNKAASIDDPTVDGKYLKQLSKSVGGVIYGCTLDGVCFSLEDLKITSSFDSSVFARGGTATCVTPDPEERGVIWVGTDESYVYKGNIFEEMKGCDAFEINPNVNINSIYSSDEGEFWVCSDNGIGVLRSDGSYEQNTDLPMNNSVESMMTDYEGNIWFVSSRQGVMKIVRTDFSDIFEKLKLEKRVVNTTCVHGEELYIGTDSGLIVLGKDGKPRDTKLTRELDGVRIRCIKSNKNKDRLWICTYSDKGLVCYDPSADSFDFYNTQNGLTSDKVRAVKELGDGTVIAATNGGAAFIKDGKYIGALTESEGIGNTEILTVCEGDDGHIYMGSDGGGILIADRDKIIKRLGLEDGLKSEIVMRIKKDPESGGYWIITGNSIAYMENEKIRTINNFPYSNNFDMVFDELDRIWVLSSNGIYIINRENMIADNNIKYSFYDLKCGLPSVATANSYSCVSENGELYIAGVSGVSSININEQKNSSNGIKLSIPYIEVDDKRIILTGQDEVNLPAECKRLTIYAYAPSFMLTSPRLSYCLEGFDDAKFTFPKQEMQPIRYTNLKSGSYRFNFSVVDSMTGEDIKTITLAFVKEKAFFEEVWFWGLVSVCVIAVGLLILLILGKVKTHRLLKKQEEHRVFVNQIIKAFAKCIDLKDKYTNGHSFRVAKYAGMIAEKMGYDEYKVTDIYNIGLLHDIGKIAVPDKILGKPERLTKEEFEIISQHALNGYEILKEIEIRPELAIGAGYHHEHIDGTGYPFGKKDDEIPMVAQIIAVADTFDAMNSTRPYRKQLYAEFIIDEMIRISGTQLNAKIVGAFLDIIREGKLDNVLVWENKSGKSHVLQNIKYAYDENRFVNASSKESGSEETREK